MRYFLHTYTGGLYILVADYWSTYKVDGSRADTELQHMYVRRIWPTRDVFLTSVSSWMRTNKLVEITSWEAHRHDAAMVDEVLERSGLWLAALVGNDAVGAD